MNEHFINRIEIKNFKCFEDFKAEGFGRVNLIGGKNNVGKTAFMEACYVNISAQNIKSFTDALGNITLRRDKLNFLLDNFRDRNPKPLIETTKKYIENLNGLIIKTDINNSEFHIIDNDDGIVDYRFIFKSRDIKININKFSYYRERIKNIKFLDTFGLSNDNIIDLYGAMQYKRKTAYLNEVLHQFDSNIEEFAIINNKPNCFKNEKFYELIELGDGTKTLISIIIALYACENGYLFIDEIDNGIHCFHLDKLWEIILTISKEQNVQVFATTHSKECIESFNKIQQKFKDEETYYFEMAKNIKTDKILMFQIDAHQLEYELTHNERFRGE